MLSKYLLILLCLAVTTTCAPIGRLRHYVYNDPRVIPYVKQWESITHRHQWTSISIVAMNDPDDVDTLGICWYSRDPLYRQIQLNANYYDYLSDVDKLVLVMHELGHCDLNYEHNTKPDMSDTCEYSIMNEYYMGEWCFNLHRDHYINEYLYEE